MKSRTAQSLRKQSGIALFIVLILLLVLAATSVALMQNQRWAVRAAADRLDVLEQTAQSSVVHEQCVARLRDALENSNTELVGYVGADQIIDVQDSKWSAADQCLYEWYQIPAQNVSGALWTPRVRINSRVQVNGVWIQALSEWRYPECDVVVPLINANCATSATPLKVADTHTELNAQFNPTQPVLSAHTQVLVK
jgi:hypothetical protein